MSEHGAVLQTYNQELVKCLEDLKQRRNELLTVIAKQQQDKAILETKIKKIQEELKILNNQLNESNKLKASYDGIIEETEQGFKKILDTSQTLLSAVQLESSRLNNSKKDKL